MSSFARAVVEVANTPRGKVKALGKQIKDKKRTRSDKGNRKKESVKGREGRRSDAPPPHVERDLL